jgi:hypothetical protein
MQHVSFLTTIGEKKNVFGFISVDARLKRKLVHLYECTAAMSVKISKAVGEAFKLCAQHLQVRAWPCSQPRLEVVELLSWGRANNLYLSISISVSKSICRTTMLEC